MFLQCLYKQGVEIIQACARIETSGAGMPASIKKTRQPVYAVHWILGSKAALNRAVVLLQEDTYINPVNGPRVIDKAFGIFTIRTGRRIDAFLEESDAHAKIYSHWG